MKFLTFRTPPARERKDTGTDNFKRISIIAEVLTEPPETGGKND